MANFGDDFQLHSPILGGTAYGVTPNFGDVDIQFGHITDGFVPYNITYHTGFAPFEKRLASLMKVLPPGSKPGLIGMRGYLDFPKLRYVQDNLSLTSDPQKIAIGVADLHEPDCSHELVLRNFFFLSVLQNLIVAEPRTPTDSFAFVAKAKVTRTPSGRLVYEANGSINIPYPTGYGWPYPNGRKLMIDSKSFLTPFVNVFAVEAKAFSEVAQIEGNHISRRVKRGMATSVKVAYSSKADAGTQWAMEIDNRRFTGRSIKPARFLDDLGDHRSVLTAEIEIVSPVRQDACIYIVQGANSVDVTCFSTREDLDFWFE